MPIIQCSYYTDLNLLFTCKTLKKYKFRLLKWYIQESVPKKTILNLSFKQTLIKPCFITEKMSKCAK